MKLHELTQPKTMTLYHGSRTEFDEFDIDRVSPNGFGRGMGFHFVSDMSLAKQYASRDGVVYVAEITISNPLMYGDAGSKGPGVDRSRVIGLGHDSFMIKERNYIEVIIFDTNQINVIDVIEQ